MGMALELFAHNQQAWTAAMDMLERCGKAAVIHPTGTGKTYIAFALCEARPNVPVLWASPSSYIYSTQREALRRNCPELTLSNVRFFTYAKLMLLTDQELDELRPAYIILDEFHRCGAQMWGQGVRRLLDRCPEAKILGLSATNIRYLDNQRNMADELFDGNVASEMTLGEAIVRGILQPPKYILSVYSYQQDLERIQRRVRRAKSREVREEGEKLLEALRRALEKADGLDEVFQKHMTDHRGKYLVFCANGEHMNEMASHVPEWFGGIDSAPHVYRAYSDDPGTSQAFSDFKADNSGHLKLLFCIDMLNEGVHVEDVSGVILFRPTISPIVYKQQIGRALSAGKTEEPVIFDIVNNIENLYSISAVQQEMREAADYFQFHGQGERIVHDRFRVVDEVGNCRQIFDQLEDTLGASWELMYRQAEAYYRQNGHLNVPRRYKTAEGYSLGNWLLTQRKVRNGEQYGRLSEERIARLDAIGMVWEDRCTAAWNRYYTALVQYRREYGDLDVPTGYESEDGIKLGSFVSNLRTARASGKHGVYLTEGRIQQLDALGMIWDKLNFLWERNYLACSEYYMRHHNLDIPAGYTAENGLKIGAWLRRQRQSRRGCGRGRLTEEQIRRLDAIGMEWEDAYTKRWEYGYGQAVKWYKAHGNLEVPTTYVDGDGFPLGKWLKRHTEVDSKTGRRAVQLTQERREKLDAMGMHWEKTDPWEVRCALAKDFYKRYGHLNVPPDYRPDGIWLSKWLNEQKQIYRGNRGEKRLTAEQIKKLEQIGIVWQKKTFRQTGVVRSEGAR